MSRISALLSVIGLAVVLVWVGLPTVQTANLPSTGLMGTVTAADGEVMEGVNVSARANSQTFTTSVYTDADGEYYFPELTDGNYKVWAQAVGYEMSSGEMAYSSGRKIEQNFTLQPTSDFSMQLSGAEWAASLPDGTPEDARLKHIFFNNCTGCHTAGFVLAKRFDAEGWSIVIDVMINEMTNPDAANRKLMQTYKDELVEYLARVRGQEDLMDYRPLPRVSGEATQVVVTEYDIPRGDDPNFRVFPNGSDWSQGAPGGDGGVLHDAVAATDGMVYFSDNTYPDRTIGRLDPQTGVVTSFALRGEDGLAHRTHGAIPDPRGGVWFNDGTDGTIVKFDTDTEQFVTFPKPEDVLPTGGHIEIDSQGRVFTNNSRPAGIVSLDPATGEYTDYEALTPGGNPYGVAVDSEDNMWMAHLGGDRLMVVNSRNGEVGEVTLTPQPGVSQRDIEIGRETGAVGNAAPLFFNGPRRMGGDPKSEYIWAALYWPGQIARINIRTREIRKYQLPSRYAHPYDVQVDRNQMVWINQMNGDRLTKFNPFTEEFTDYPLPSVGSETRHISIDDTTNPPTVWLAYSGLAKLARVQFRTDTAGTTTTAANSQ